MRRVPVLLSLVAVVLVGVFSGRSVLDAVAQNGTPVAGDTEAVVRRVFDAFNQVFATGDTSGIDAVFAADYVDHTPGDPSAGDREGLKAEVAGFRAVAPDAAFTVEDVIVEVDRAAARVTLRATLDPAAMGMPGSEGVPLTMGAIVILVVDRGQVVESWDQDDFAEQLAMMAGMGMAATPAP